MDTTYCVMQVNFYDQEFPALHKHNYTCFVEVDLWDSSAKIIFPELKKMNNCPINDE